MKCIREGEQKQEQERTDVKDVEDEIEEQNQKSGAVIIQGHYSIDASGAEMADSASGPSLPIPPAVPAAQ